VASRRRRPTLDRDRIVAAAITLADADGIEAVTMRRLGQALGVEAMSLYHHVANKDLLLDAMVDAVFAEVDLPRSDGPWRVELERRCRSLRTVLRRHPWGVALLDSRAAPGPTTLRHHEAVIACMRAGGFPVALAASAFSVLDSYVYGFAIQEAAVPFDVDGPGRATPEDLAALAADMLAPYSSGEFPSLEELAREHVSRPEYSFAAEFEFGLTLVLDGLATARRRTRRPPATMSR
jgi:AcrR family transcriptional regulator